MAIRCDNSADGIGRTTNLINHNTAYTKCGWFKLVSGTGGAFFTTGTGEAGTVYDFIGLSGGAFYIEIYDGVTSDTTTPAFPGSGIWVYIAVIRESATSLKVYQGDIDSVAGQVGNELTLDVSARAANTFERSGRFNDTYPNALNGLIAHPKAWTRALSLSEIIAEQFSITPRSFVNLHHWTPTFPGATERLRDYSINQYNWTEMGTLTDEPGPPVSWGIWAPPRVVYVAAAGGTTYNQSLSGAITPAATLLNQSQKVFAGSVTPTAILINQSQKVLIGTLTPGGVLLNQMQKILSGDLTPTGTLLNQAQKVLSGNIVPGGTLLNQAQKVLSGSITPISTLINQTQKVLSGSITPSGILVGVKTALISLVGSLTPGGTLTKEAQKVLTGSVSPLGQLLKETQKVLSGNITPGGILASTKMALISLVGSLTPSGSLSKETQKTLSGIITPVGSILKQVGKLLDGALTPVGVLVASLVSTNLESTFKGMFKGMFRRMK